MRISPSFIRNTSLPCAGIIGLASTALIHSDTPLAKVSCCILNFAIVNYLNFINLQALVCSPLILRRCLNLDRTFVSLLAQTHFSDSSLCLAYVHCPQVILLSSIQLSTFTGSSTSFSLSLSLASAISASLRASSFFISSLSLLL